MAKIFGRKPETVRSVYQRYVNTGIQTNQRVTQKPSKLSQEQKQLICQWVDESCSLTLEELVNKCLKEWPQMGSISQSTVCRALKSFHDAFKRVSYIPKRWNDPDVIAERREYAVIYTQLKFQNKTFLFIDEMIVQIFSRASGGRCPKGVKAS